MSKLFRLAFAQGGVGLCGGLLLASGLTLGLVAVRSVWAQDLRSPSGGSPPSRPLSRPPVGQILPTYPGFPDEEECKAFRPLVDTARKGLESPALTQSQAWREARERVTRLHERLPVQTSSRLERLMDCACSLFSAYQGLEQLWKIHNDPRERALRDRSPALWDQENASALKHAQNSLKSTEECFNKACVEPQRARAAACSRVAAKRGQPPSGATAGQPVSAGKGGAMSYGDPPAGSSEYLDISDPYDFPTLFSGARDLAAAYNAGVAQGQKAERILAAQDRLDNCLGHEWGDGLEYEDRYVPDRYVPRKQFPDLAVRGERTNLREKIVDFMSEWECWLRGDSHPPADHNQFVARHAELLRKLRDLGQRAGVFNNGRLTGLRRFANDPGIPPQARACINTLKADLQRLGQ